MGKMENERLNTLVNPQNGHLAFKIFSFDDNGPFDHLQRLNYYTILLVLEGEGELKADFSGYHFAGESLMSFSPYQPFMIETRGKFRGYALNFHPDFFCIHKHQQEVACNGVLFNNIYEPPFHALEDGLAEKLLGLIDQMKKELQHTALAQYELLVSYLKIFLITASRSRLEKIPQSQQPDPGSPEPFVLQKLSRAIESHYRQKHSAGDYAQMLHISPKALAKITKTHYNKTPTHLISERIIIEAKRELYMTSKPVKAIASELGFEDEYYFSRFFKINSGVSPQLYRDSVGFARAEERAN